MSLSNNCSHKQICSLSLKRTCFLNTLPNFHYNRNDLRQWSSVSLNQVNRYNFVVGKLWTLKYCISCQHLCEYFTFLTTEVFVVWLYITVHSFQAVPLNTSVCRPCYSWVCEKSHRPLFKNWTGKVTIMLSPLTAYLILLCHCICNCWMVSLSNITVKLWLLNGLFGIVWQQWKDGRGQQFHDYAR